MDSLKDYWIFHDTELSMCVRACTDSVVIYYVSVQE